MFSWFYAREKLNTVKLDIGKIYCIDLLNASRGFIEICVDHSSLDIGPTVCRRNVSIFL